MHEELAQVRSSLSEKNHYLDLSFISWSLALGAFFITLLSVETISSSKGLESNPPNRNNG